MSRSHNRRDHDLQLPFPGCVGRMINIFDLSASMSGNKLLTDRAHRDESPVLRRKSDTKKVTHPVGGYVNEKQTGREMKRRSSSQKSGATPVKMLIAEEMSKETESRRKSPSIVARLMGLDDDMPAQQPVVAASKRSLHGDYPRSNLPGRQEKDVLRKMMPHDVHRSDYEGMDFKDIHEVWQQPSRVSITKEQYVQWGNCKANNTDKRMALVQQKFMEAKQLATDEKLLHSQEFHNALEVLSSNRDLFLKFLEEPRSPYSQQINDFETVPTRRITILKPSKTPEAKSVKLIQRPHYRTVDDKRCESTKPRWNSNYTNLKAERSSQTTKIVVLKPSTAKPHGMKANISHPTSQKLLEQNYVSGDSEDNDDMGSRHVRKDFTQQMLEISNCHRRDESLLSRVYSNGYAGDDSSFYRSESEYIEEDGCCFSDSEAVTPTVRHSWDYTNRFGSPYSVTSFSRDSYSPESSVIKEAKKRLSERLALVAANGINQEVHLQRSSSTLGQMLAIRDVKKRESTNGQSSGSKSYVHENELRSPASFTSISRAKDTEGDVSISSLSRSKSVPASSSTYEDIGLKVESSSSQITKSTKSKEVAKSKKGKMSFKGRVSSLFFSRNKKPNGEEHVSLPRKKEKPDSQHLVGFNDKMQSGDILPAVDGKDELLAHGGLPVERPQNFDEGSKTESPKPVIDGTKEEPRIYNNLYDKDTLKNYETLSANQDQPSPTSVLDPLFQDEGNDSGPPSSESDRGQLKQLSRASNVDSVARILSWDDCHLDLSTTKLSSSCSPLSEGPEHEYNVTIRKLLLSAGLWTSNTFFAGWHSLDSPLDPMLFDKFCDNQDEEAMCREKKANMKLLFDCVNSALVEIGGSAFLSAYPWTKSSLVPRKDVYPDAKSSLDVLGLVVNWLSGRLRVPAESEDSNQMVDTVLRREIGGKAWAESMKLEVEEFNKEISGEVLNDLVVEALADFTGIQ